MKQSGSLGECSLTQAEAEWVEWERSSLVSLRTPTLLLSEGVVVLTDTKAAGVGWFWFQVEFALLAKNS